jgi:hypothetical protein
MNRLCVQCFLAGAMALLALLLSAASEPTHSRYLFVWAMEAQRPNASRQALMSGDVDGYRRSLGTGKDFMAVFDVAPDVRPFGKLVAMLPVGEATLAHHTNYALPPNGQLYANDWGGNNTYVFDLHDPLHPGLLRRFGSVAGYSYPHSFSYLSNGNTLATFQYSGDAFDDAPGGLVEFGPDGRVVRTGPAAPQLHPNIRPYSLAVVEKLDRVVTGSADMADMHTSHVAQVWRLSDLKLLRTIVLPKRSDSIYDDAADSSEPRVLADGTTVVVPTFNCGLFLMRDVGRSDPTLQHIYDFGYRTCEVPVVVGNYLVQAMQSGHAIVSLNMADPEHPHEVSRILLGPGDYPHWIAIEPNSDRLVITGYGELYTRALFATIDRKTGRLMLDPQSIDFTRNWPDGWNGSAIPHGAVFSDQ